MARRTVIWMAAAFLAVLIVPVAPAAAGGGCHQGVTHGDGDTVEMVDACFTPTILTVDPGETVTVNTDRSSGSWRRAARRAEMKLSVSFPTSR